MENKFMRVEEVAAELGVSASYAYKVIRRLNDELKAKGFVTIAGRINRQCLSEDDPYPNTAGGISVRRYPDYRCGRLAVKGTHMMLR